MKTRNCLMTIGVAALAALAAITINVSASNMKGSPKAIQACVEHPGTMPGCNPVTVAPLK